MCHIQWQSTIGARPHLSDSTKPWAAPLQQPAAETRTSELRGRLPGMLGSSDLGCVVSDSDVAISIGHHTRLRFFRSGSVLASPQATAAQQAGTAAGKQLHVRLATTPSSPRVSPLSTPAASPRVAAAEDGAGQVSEAHEEPKPALQPAHGQSSAAVKSLASDLYLPDTLKVGMRVRRGPDWSEADGDQDKGCDGVVVRVTKRGSGRLALVRWEHGETFKYWYRDEQHEIAAVRSSAVAELWSSGALARYSKTQAAYRTMGAESEETVRMAAYVPGFTREQKQGIKLRTLADVYSFLGVAEGADASNRNRVAAFVLRYALPVVLKEHLSLLAARGDAARACGDEITAALALLDGAAGVLDCKTIANSETATMNALMKFGVLFEGICKDRPEDRSEMRMVIDLIECLKAFRSDGSSEGDSVPQLGEAGDRATVTAASYFVCMAYGIPGRSTRGFPEIEFDGRGPDLQLHIQEGAAAGETASESAAMDARHFIVSKRVLEIKSAYGEVRMKDASGQLQVKLATLALLHRMLFAEAGSADEPKGLVLVTYQLTGAVQFRLPRRPGVSKVTPVVKSLQLPWPNKLSASATTASDGTGVSGDSSQKVVEAGEWWSWLPKVDVQMRIVCTNDVQTEAELSPDSDADSDSGSDSDSTDTDEDETFIPRALSRGMRVRRGRDWRWDDQDASGDGVVVGTQLGGNKLSHGWVNVRWPDGAINCYRYNKRARDLVAVRRAPHKPSSVHEAGESPPAAHEALWPPATTSGAATRGAALLSPADAAASHPSLSADPS